MKPEWRRQSVPLKFQLSDKTLFSRTVDVMVQSPGLSRDRAPTDLSRAPEAPLEPGCSGYLLRAVPCEAGQPMLQRVGEFLRYIPAEFPRYFIDLDQTFDDYTKQFSSKSRSTIRRKIKKFAKHCGGDIQWRSHKTRDELAEFYATARDLSSRTYQEKLLGSGLPDSDEFRDNMLRLADEDRVRGYLLFDRDRAVAYLYCPADGDVLLYAYLGYDPDYMKLSVGTILHWHAFEEIFAERRFSLFDFTEGESDQKKFFATGHVDCANVFFLRRTLRVGVLLRSHARTERFSRWAGRALDRYGLKKKVKRLIRFGRS